MREFIIQKNEENQRLDKYLKKLLPNASGGFLYKMMRKKNIVVNKKKVEGQEKLLAGDVVTLFLSEETFLKFHTDLTALRAEYESLSRLGMKGLKIVFEDSDMILVNKPYNLLSQKASEKDISANEILIGYMIRKGELTFEEFQTFRPSVVNRLDRNTTGLLVFGKTLKGLQELTAGFKDRSIGKFYHAICYGTIDEEVSLRGYLKKDEAKNKVTFFKEPVEGAEAIASDIRPLQVANGLTLAEIHLITGKTHQIRLHLASIGHPILGDMKYGNQKINQKYYESHKVNHQLLHAYRVVFPDGRTFTAEPELVYQKLIN